MLASKDLSDLKNSCLTNFTAPVGIDPYAPEANPDLYCSNYATQISLQKYVLCQDGCKVS
jgi:hypothetical protein